MKRKKSQHQKVVIPKGMINPNETTIIEIPILLQKQPVLIAKKKADSSGPLCTATYDMKPNATSSRMSYGKNSDSLFSVSDDDISQIQMQTARLNQSALSYFDAEDDDLDTTEYKEKKVLEKRLLDFQRARRRLLEKAPRGLNHDDDDDDDDDSFWSFEAPTVVKARRERSYRSDCDRRECGSSKGRKAAKGSPVRNDSNGRDTWRENCPSHCDSEPPPERNQCCSSTNTKSNSRQFSSSTCASPECGSPKRLVPKKSNGCKDTKSCHFSPPYD